MLMDTDSAKDSYFENWYIYFFGKQRFIVLDFVWTAFFIKLLFWQQFHIFCFRNTFSKRFI